MRIGFLLFCAASVSCKFNKFYQTSFLFYILVVLVLLVWVLIKCFSKYGFFKVIRFNGGLPDFLFRCSG